MVQRKRRPEPRPEGRLAEESISIQARASEIRAAALLPSLSAQRYEDAWSKFMAWRETLTDARDEPDDNLLLVYAHHLSSSLAPTSLWTTFSMIKRQMLVISNGNYLD